MNFRSLQKFTFISAGFLAGVIWIAACGGGASGVAADAIEAIAVLYDNATSGLTAETVQAAIDELKVAVDAVPAAYTDADAQAALADQDVTLGAVTADSFTFGAVQTGYLSLPGVSFAPVQVINGGAQNEYSYSSGALDGDSNALYTDFFAPVLLPQGATVVSLTVVGTDGGPGDLTVELSRRPDSGAADSLASLTLEGDGNTTDDTVSNATVDNQTYMYYLRAELPDDSFRLLRALITYTYATPTF